MRVWYGINYTESLAFDSGINSIPTLMYDESHPPSPLLGLSDGMTLEDSSGGLSPLSKKAKRHLGHDVMWRGQVARGGLFNFRGGTFSEDKPIGDMA